MTGMRIMNVSLLRMIGSCTTHKAFATLGGSSRNQSTSRPCSSAASKRIAVVHAMLGSVKPTVEAFATQWPQARLQHIIDDSLSSDVSVTGLDEEMHGRIRDLAGYAVRYGAEGLLFSCSAFGCCIDAVKAEFPQLPVLKPNEAMMEEAVEIGGRIGILSVFEPTIPSISAELQVIAANAQKRIHIVPKFIPGALDLLQSGNVEKYRWDIAEKARLLLQSNPDLSCIVLAMFSMATAGEAVRIALPQSVPVLTSPTSAVLRMKGLLL